MEKDIQKIYDIVTNKKAKNSLPIQTTKYILSQDPTDTKVLILEDGTKVNLTRIVATRDIKTETKQLIVRKGTKGGYVESETNLSQEGSCWIFSDAAVFGFARIEDDAKVRNNAMVYENAEISDKAEVMYQAVVKGDVLVFERAIIRGHSLIYGNAQISGSTTISGNPQIYGNAQISGTSRIFDASIVKDDAIVIDSGIGGETLICGQANIDSSSICDSTIYQSAKVSDSFVEKSLIYGKASVQTATIRDESKVGDNVTLVGEHIDYLEPNYGSDNRSIHIISSKITGKTIIKNELEQAPDFSYNTRVFKSIINNSLVPENVWISNCNINGITLEPGTNLRNEDTQVAPHMTDVEDLPTFSTYEKSLSTDETTVTTEDNLNIPKPEQFSTSNPITENKFEDDACQ